MSSVGVVGANLAGMSAAARLARAGHDVTLYEADDQLGGIWSHPTGWPGSIMVPAAWRDLFRKTGRPLPTTLTQQGLDLVPDAPQRHVLLGGSFLDLPTDRAEQHHALAAVLGEVVAQQWQEVLDEADETWQTLRPLGMEADEPLSRERSRALHSRTSLAKVARRLPHPLHEILLSAVAPEDPTLTPAWTAARTWAPQRLFGRWRLVRTEDQAPVAPNVLTHLLAARLEERGVTVRTGTTVASLTSDRVTDVDGRAAAHDAVVDATSPWSGLSREVYGLVPAVYPTVRLEQADGPEPETFDHSTGVRTWTYAGDTAWFRVVSDTRLKTENPAYGARWEGSRTMRRRPLTRGSDGVFRASTANRAGAEPWGQLLTGALVTYAVHEHLSGESIRPVDDPRRRGHEAPASFT